MPGAEVDIDNAVVDSMYMNPGLISLKVLWGRYSLMKLA